MRLTKAQREHLEWRPRDERERLYRTPERFGICEDTGEPIPFARLNVIPWARTCNETNC